MDDLFLKIIDREVPANIIYEDEIALAFEDINPQAPTHILVIPKTHIPKLSDADSSQKDILGHLMWATGEIARQLDIEDAYRVVVNNGAKAGQSVFHLHLHILSGRVFSWPPG